MICNNTDRLRNIAKSFGYISKRQIIKKAVTVQRKIQRFITFLVFRCFVYPADTTKSPARRPGGFEIRRKKGSTY